jgi:hypothetical protein
MAVPTVDPKGTGLSDFLTAGCIRRLASRNGLAAAVMPLRDRSAGPAVRWPGDGLIQ